MELNCPSLDYVYDMTWAEFRIRMYGYNRMQDREDIRAREISWNALIAPSRDPKKLPKTKDKFWQIGTKEVSINEGMKEAIKQAQQEYFNKVKNGK